MIACKSLLELYLNSYFYKNILFFKIIKSDGCSTNLRSCGVGVGGSNSILIKNKCRI